MIKVSSSDGIKQQMIRYLGSGEESYVGLLEDGIHVAKVFHQPREMNEQYNLLMGKDLNQDSFAFLKDLYYCNTFIYGAIADYVPGNSLDSKLVEVSFMDLLYSTLLLKKDIKTISEAGIEVHDWKTFNMKYTDDYIKIIDTGRFEYSNLSTAKIYDHNLSMIFSVIKNTYSNNLVLKEILERDGKLKMRFRDNENFSEFFKDLEKYTQNELGEPVKSLGDYIRIVKK